MVVCAVRVPLRPVMIAGHHGGHGAGIPGVGIAVLAKIRDEIGRNNLLAVYLAAQSVQFPKPREVAQGNVETALGLGSTVAVEHQIGIEFGTHGPPDQL